MIHDGGRALYKIYPLAYQLPCIKIRNMVMEMLDCLSNPHPTRVQRGWERETCWVSDARFFHIDANKLGNLETDLRQIRWAEELKLVELFLFDGVSPIATVEAEGVLVLQNSWAYSKVLTLLHSDRIVVLGRNCAMSGIGVTYGMPNLPSVYQILSPLESTPSFSLVPASHFHGYKPEVDYAPLAKSEGSCS